MITKTTILLLLGDIGKRSAPTVGLVGGLALPSVIVVSAVTAETSTPPPILDSTMQLEKGTLTESELSPADDPNAITEDDDSEEGDGEDGTEDDEEDSDDDDDDGAQTDDEDEEEEEDDEPKSVLHGRLSNIASRLGEVGTKYSTFKSKLGSDPAGGFKPMFEFYSKASTFAETMFPTVFTKDENKEGEDDTFTKALQSSNDQSWFSFAADALETLFKPSTTSDQQDST